MTVQPCQIDLLLARAQVFLATLLILGFFGALFAVLFVIGVKHVDLSASALTLFTTAITASITMASGAAGYFFLRHRPQTVADTDEPTPVPTTPAEPAK